MEETEVKTPGFIMTPQAILGDHFPYHVIGLYDKVKYICYWSRLRLCYQSLGSLAKSGRISDEVVSRELKVLQYFGLIKYEGFTEHDTFAFSVPPLSFETKKMIGLRLTPNGPYKEWVATSEEIASEVYRSKDFRISIAALAKKLGFEKDEVLEELDF